MMLPLQLAALGVLWLWAWRYVPAGPRVKQIGTQVVASVICVAVLIWAVWLLIQTVR